MKYTDEQRIEKMIAKTEKLLDYLSENGVTREGRSVTGTTALDHHNAAV